MKYLLIILTFIAMLIGCSPSQKDIDKAVANYFQKEENERAKIISIIREELRREGLIRDGVRTAPPPNQLTFNAKEIAQDLSIIKKDGSPMLGPINAPIEIILFSEFQCPYCRTMALTLKELLKKHPQKIKIIFKHLPLSFHQRAKEAALFSMRASESGNFWRIHDLLFEKQKELSHLNFHTLAKDLKLNSKDFEQDKNNLNHINRDMKEAEKLGITGTPTLFINGEKVVGAKPLEELLTIISQKLK